MSIHNNEIANMFDELADLLEIEGSNRFRVRAYRNAARTIRKHTKKMAQLIEQHRDLTELPDIGNDLADKIKTIVETGQLPLLEKVHSRTPATLSQIMKIRGLGPKRVKALHESLKIKTLDDLKHAANSGRIRELEGFGKKTEQMIKMRTEEFSEAEKRIKLIEAEEIATSLREYIKKSRGIKDFNIAGSYRRRKDTIGDLDILVTAGKNTDVMQRFVTYDRVREVLSQRETRSTIRLRTGLSVDLRVIPEKSYGAALHYFTGSKAHNIAVRKLALKKKIKINEYGVFKGEKRIAGNTEKEVYAQVGLPYIEPELRENRGEVDAAKRGKLPELINLEDIRGDLHCHTGATDGKNTLKEMAQAAAKRGYEYISINDHSKHMAVASGLGEKKLLEQIETIDKLNETLEDIVILKSIEVDILQDGSLDLPARVLKELDFTVGAVHSNFNLSRSQQTKRLLHAMDNPYFNILAHPTGRLINARKAYEVDLEKIMQGAKERGCFIELNAHPARLDLTDDACLMAKHTGLNIVISTDAHRTSDLDFMPYGINQARRAWLEAGDVINCLPLKKLKKTLSRK